MPGEDDQISPNYIWIVFSKELAVFLEQLDADTSVGDLSAEIEFQDGIDGVPEVNYGIYCIGEKCRQSGNGYHA